MELKGSFILFSLPWGEASPPSLPASSPSLAYTMTPGAWHRLGVGRQRQKKSSQSAFFQRIQNPDGDSNICMNTYNNDVLYVITGEWQRSGASVFVTQAPMTSTVSRPFSS